MHKSLLVHCVCDDPRCPYQAYGEMHRLAADLAGKITLRGLLCRFGRWFYPQTWYEGEAFMDRWVPYYHHPWSLPPRGFTSTTEALPAALPAVVTVAIFYILYPKLPVWQKYIWTEDTDAMGQRVYLGDNGRGLEIHRHIHLTERFGILTW